MTAPTAAEAAVRRVETLLTQRIGLRPEGTLRGRLRRCVLDGAARQGNGLDAYVQSLSRDAAALQELVNRVTVQESGFFRHPDHFAILAEEILPDVDQPVTVWSAACANGQEAYSLAMVMEEQAIRGSVVATDLSTAALGRTEAAWYSAREADGISAGRRVSHLVEQGRGWQMGDRVHSRVTTRRHNLIDALPGHVGSCQVVFCRNVLIYLSAEHARDFLDRLADSMSPGAYLFLGASESLWHVSERFQAVRLGRSFVYRRREAALAVRRAEPRPEPRPASVPHRAAPIALPRESARPEAATRMVDEAAGDTALTATLAETGRVALAAGDTAAAIVAFRKWVYLAPHDAVGALHLGLALEAGGHTKSARRAFGVAKSVLLETGPASMESALKGFAMEELIKLLDTKRVVAP
jgi:chemotaxis methyl-accepting protein methylase